MPSVRSGVHDVVRVLRAPSPRRPVAKRARELVGDVERDEDRELPREAAPAVREQRADRAHRPEQGMTRRACYASAPADRPRRCRAPRPRRRLLGGRVAGRDGLGLAARRRSLSMAAKALLMAGSAIGCFVQQLRSRARRSASKSSARSVVLVLVEHRRPSRAARGRARRARARRRSGASFALAGRSGSPKSGIAVVVQVLQILVGPRRRSRTSAGRSATALRARRARPCRRAGARRARGRRRRPRRSARGRAGGRCPRGRPRPSRGRARRRRSRSPACRDGAAAARRSRPAGRAGRRSATRPRRAPGAPWSARAGPRRGRCASAPRPRRRARAGAGASRSRRRARRSARRASVSSSVTRRPRAISSSRPSEMSLRLVREPLRPLRMRISVKTSTAAPIATSTQTRAPPPEPGPAAAEEGRAAAASSGGAERGGSGGASAGSAWDRPLGGHRPSVGALAGCACPPREGFDAIGSYVQFLIMRHSCFRLRVTLRIGGAALRCPHEYKEQHAV